MPPWSGVIIGTGTLAASAVGLAATILAVHAAILGAIGVACIGCFCAILPWAIKAGL